MMKVAFNASSLLSAMTGIGSYTFNLARSLQTIKDIELNLFYSDYWSEQLTRTRKQKKISPLKDHIRDFVPYSYQAKRLFQQYYFSKGQKNKPSDIYHEPNFYSFDFKGPTVITVHDLSWIRYPETHPKNRVNAMDRYFETSLRNASHIITDSEFIRTEVVDVFNIEPHSITAIPLGVSSIYRPYEDTDTRTTLDNFSLSRGKYFLLLGTLEPRKNILIAIEAFLNLPQNIRKNYPLVLVGMKGWHTSEIENRISPLIARGEIKALGYLPEDQLVKVISGALCLLYPSIYEGFGLPPLEAMACGTPVIASNSSSIPEVVGDAGILLNPMDIEGFSNAMMRMISSPEERSAFAPIGVARSQLFNWNRCALETYKIYQKVLSE